MRGGGYEGACGHRGPYRRRLGNHRSAAIRLLAAASGPHLANPNAYSPRYVHSYGHVDPYVDAISDPDSDKHAHCLAHPYQHTTPNRHAGHPTHTGRYSNAVPYPHCHSQQHTCSQPGAHGPSHITTNGHPTA